MINHSELIGLWNGSPPLIVKNQEAVIRHIPADGILNWFWYPKYCILNLSVLPMLKALDNSSFLRGFFTKSPVLKDSSQFEGIPFF
jgi:hypothetical protein